MNFYDISVYKVGKNYKIIYNNRNVNEYSDKRYFDLHYPVEHQEQFSDRFLCNIIRARNTVQSIALCNDWQYFVTATLDPRKYDRYNLEQWRKDFSQWIRNQRKIHDQNIQYLLVPEQHKNMAWHMHGLFSGIPWDFLQRFDPQKHPLRLCSAGYRFHAGMGDRFGFNSFGKVQSSEAVSRYIVKYISKGFSETDLDSGAHLYYASQGLKRPERVQQGCSTVLLTDPDFQCEFCSISVVSEEVYKSIKDFIY